MASSSGRSLSRWSSLGPRPWLTLGLLPEAACYLCLTRMLLLIFAYARVIRFLGLRLDTASEGATAPTVQIAPLALAVDIAARRLVPGSSCLVRALAAYRMLRRRGLRPVLCVAVLKPDEILSAHAWLRLGSDWVTGRKGSAGARMVVCYR